MGVLWLLLSRSIPPFFTAWLEASEIMGGGMILPFAPEDAVALKNAAELPEDNFSVFFFLTQLGFWLEFSDIRLWPYINERRLHVIPSYGSDWRVLQYMLRKSQTPGISICFRKCFSEVTCLRRTKTATRCCWCKIKAWESQVKFGRSEICNTEPITYDFKGQKV